MSRPIRSLTEGKGHDVRHHRLAAFGGAGGQHACSVARILGITEVVIHKYSSILSAYGMALADVVHESIEPSSEVLSHDSLPRLRARLDALQQQAREPLLSQGFSDGNLRYERYLNLRYQGSNSALMITEPEDGDFETAFCKDHQRQFSFTVPGRKIVVDDIWVRAVASDPFISKSPSLARELAWTSQNPRCVPANLACRQTTVCFEETGRIPTDVYELNHLPKKHYVSVG